MYTLHHGWIMASFDATATVDHALHLARTESASHLTIVRRRGEVLAAGEYGKVRWVKECACSERTPLGVCMRCYDTRLLQTEGYVQK